MLYIAAAILIILGFIFPKNKAVTVLFLLLYWILLGFNTGNADFEAYENIYAQIGVGNLWGTSVDEEGFIYLMYFCSNTLHFTYPEFLIFFSTICTALLAVVAVLYSKNRNIVLGLFLLYSYWVMVVQIRSHLATLLALIGVYFLIYYNDKKSIALFFGFVLVSIFFHRSMVFFLPLCLVRFLDVKRTAIVTAICSAGFLSIRLPFVASLMGTFLSQEKINSWLLSDRDRTLFSLLMLVTIRVIYLAAVYFLYSSLNKNSYLFEKMQHVIQGSSKVTYDVLAERIFKISILGMAYIALEAFSKDYERLFRLVIFLSYVMFADYTCAKRVSMGKIQLSYISYYAFVIVFLGYFFYVYGGWIDIAFRPVFESNSLIGA